MLSSCRSAGLRCASCGEGLQGRDPMGVAPDAPQVGGVPVCGVGGTHRPPSLSSGRCVRPGVAGRREHRRSSPARATPTPASSPPQNRPSVITCASASTRNCNLSHCPIAHSGCVAAGPASYRRAPSCKSPCGGREGRGRGAIFLDVAQAECLHPSYVVPWTEQLAPGACSVEAETVVVWSTWHVGCVWPEWDWEGASRIPLDLGQALFCL